MDNTDFSRIEDESALRSKVDEALTVYDEYVKTKGGDAEASGETASASEEAKDAEKAEQKA